MGCREKESLVNQCDALCAEVDICDHCPAPMYTGKRGESCDFEEMSEAELDEVIQAFKRAGYDTVDAKKFEVKKVAPATETSLKDAIHPHHYKLPGGMQVIDVEVAMFGREAVMHHCLCTAAEYILRSQQKNGVEDIKKAHWWLCKYIELEAESK